MDSNLKRTLIYLIPFPLGFIGFNGIISYFFPSIDNFSLVVGLKGSIALILMYCLIVRIMAEIEKRYDRYVEKAELEQLEET